MAIATLIVAIVAGIITGAIVALRYVAPRTATKRDDQARDLLEKAIPFLPDELKAIVEKHVETK